MAMALLSLGKVPLHSSCSPLPWLPPPLDGHKAGFTCPMQAGLPIPFWRGPLQPGLGELSHTSEEKAGGEGIPSKRKEVRPLQPSATGDREVTEAALSTPQVGGGPAAPRGEAARWHLQPLGKEVSPLPHLPPSRPPRHAESSAEHQGSSSPLAANSRTIYTGAAMGEQPWHRVAVSEDISGARKAGVPPAPRQIAVQRGPCLPGPATEPPTTRGPHFKQLCSSYSSSSYYARYSPTKQSSSPLRI